LHAGAISEGFLSALGPEFLRLLYRRICRSPTSFLMVADEHGRLVGFVAGSADVGGLYRTFVVRDGPAVVLHAGRHLLWRWRRTLETIRHGRKDAPGTGRGPELLAIAVSADRREAGVGARLVDAFLQEVRTRGASAAYVVVAAANGPAIGLYQRAGFVIAGEFELHPGTGSVLMQWERGKRPSDRTDRADQPPNPTGRS